MGSPRSGGMRRRIPRRVSGSWNEVIVFVVVSVFVFFFLVKRRKSVWEAR